MSLMNMKTRRREKIKKKKTKNPPFLKKRLKTTKIKKMRRLTKKINMKYFGRILEKTLNLE